MPPNPVQQLIHAARRRNLLVNALTELPVILGIGFAFFTLMVLMGTDVFRPLVMCILLAAVSLTSVFRIRQRLVDNYQLAQILDHRLKLTDTISTAWYLLGQAEPTRVQRLQLEQASHTAASTRLDSAFPIRVSRLWALTGALAALAFGTFALRYLLQNSLDLRLPLVHLTVRALFPKDSSASAHKDAVAELRADAAKSASPKPAADRARERPQDPADLPPPVPKPNGTGASSGDAGGKRNGGTDDSASPGADAKSNPGSQPGASTSPSTASAGSPGTSPKSQEGASAKPGVSGNDASPGLMSRMRDALHNMVDQTFNKQSGRSDSKQSAASGNQPSDPGKTGQGTQSPGQQSATQPGTPGEQGSSADNDTNGQGQPADKPGNAQGRGSSNSPSSGSDSQSGVGSQDGNKDLRDAEQQQAMGKLAEILSKRSASLEGDMTVETPSGHQQLQTQYSNQRSAHSDSGVVINRNEVPLRYQQYIRDYMEKARRSAMNSTAR